MRTGCATRLGVRHVPITNLNFSFHLDEIWYQNLNHTSLILFLIFLFKKNQIKKFRENFFKKKEQKNGEETEKIE